MMETPLMLPKAVQAAQGRDLESSLDRDDNVKTQCVLELEDTVKTQCWLELEDFVTWPVEKKIPKTRNNSARNVSVNFADEKGCQLTEVQHVEAFKKRSHPVVWFWWAVANEEEAKEWPSYRFWAGGNCWIVSDQAPKPPPMAHQKSVEDRGLAVAGQPAPVGQRAPAQANAQSHRSMDMSTQERPAVQNPTAGTEVTVPQTAASIYNEPSDNDHSNSRIEAVISERDVAADKDSGEDHGDSGSDAQSSDRRGGKDHGNSGSKGQASKWSEQDAFEMRGTAGKGTVSEEHSDNVNGSATLEAPDSEWCDVVIKRLQAENAAVRNTGLMLLLSNDLRPKNGDVIMPLALSSHGYQVVLQALAVAPCGPNAEQKMIISALQGNVKELIASPYGCEVLQMCVECAVPSAVSFVVTELQGCACSVARASGQYQLICRLLEHLPSSTTESLVEELFGEIRELCYRKRGNHVVQQLLE